MSELAEQINEYIQNTQELLEEASQETEKFQKEASEYKKKLEERPTGPFIEKDAAIQVAGTLIGKGLIQAEELSQTIEDICADPLGVITKISKVASIQNSVPSVGQGSTKKSGTGAFSTENLSNADKALLKRIRLI